jgi:hypothetical protein
MIKEVIFDDLDEVSNLDDDTVSRRVFGVGDNTYEVHLSEENYGQIHEALAKFVEVARLVSGRRTSRSVSASAPSPASTKPAKMDPEQSQAVRQWAAQYVSISQRGRIPLEVLTAYNNDRDVTALKVWAENRKPAKLTTPEPASGASSEPEFATAGAWGAMD